MDFARAKVLAGRPDQAPGLKICFAGEKHTNSFSGGRAEGVK